MKRLILITCLGAAGLLAAPGRCGAMTFGQLKSLIKNEDVRSIENLLVKLPDDLRSGFTLMHRSRSLQGADADFPRTILFGDTAELILAFNGRQGQAGFNELEVLEFDKVEKRFRLHEIHFQSDGQARAVFSKPNPQKCLTCHGADPKPIWEGYNFWRGAYGSIDDALDPNPECVGCGNSEAAKFSHFRVVAATHSRYRSLIWRDSTWPFYTRSGGNRKLSRMPNTRLTVLNAFHNSQRMARKLDHAQQFRNLKFGAAFALVCGENDPLARAILERMKTCAMPAREEAWLLGQKAWLDEVMRSASGSSTWTKRASLVFHFIGLEFGSSAMTLKPHRGEELETGFPNGLLGGDSHAYLIVSLLNHLAESDEFLRSRLIESKRGFPYGQYDSGVSDAFFKHLRPGFINGDLFKSKACGYVEKRAAEELTVSLGLAKCASEEGERPDDSLEWKLNAGRKLLVAGRCIDCHDPGSEGKMGPPIPFASQVEFRKLSEQTETAGRPIMQVIARMLSERVEPEGRMPLVFRDFSVEEQDWLLTYLRGRKD